MALDSQIYQEDAEYIIGKVLDAHPAPDYKIGKARLKYLEHEFRSKASGCSSINEFWQAAQCFVAGIGDAHTSMLPLKTEQVLAPVTLAWVEGQVVIDEVAVHDEHQLDQLKKGDQVLFVDSTEIGALIKQRLELVPYNYYDYGVKEVVDRLLHFPSGKEQLELTVAQPDGKVQTVSLPLYDTSDSRISAWRQQRTRLRLQQLITWEVWPDTRTGYLRYQRCADRSVESIVAEAEKVGLKAEDVPFMPEVCRELFSAMQDANCRSLIIDLRDNSGGAAVIAHTLLNYLTRRPIKTYGGAVKVSASAKEFLEKNRSMYPRQYQKYVDKLLALAVGTVREFESAAMEFPYDGSKEVEYPLFEGKIFVLINPGTFSSGEWLAAELKDNGIGIFVGEPTGGGGTVPGDTLHFRAPNTGLGFVVSHKLATRPDRQAERWPAVMPDYYVRQQLADFLQGRDTVVEWLKKRLDLL